MKKIVLSATVILAFLLYAVHSHSEASEVPVITSPQSNTSLVVPSSTPQSLPDQSSSNPTPQATTTPTAQKSSFKDGTYTGNSVDAFYGNVQVKATVSNGKITDVVFLDYPQDRRTSQEINAQAMPFLKQEAISAQSANVDIVTGATQTSLAFQKSLQSALNQAKS